MRHPYHLSLRYSQVTDADNSTHPLVTPYLHRTLIIARDGQIIAIGELPESVKDKLPDNAVHYESMDDAPDEPGDAIVPVCGGYPQMLGRDDLHTILKGVSIHHSFSPHSNTRPVFVQDFSKKRNGKG